MITNNTNQHEKDLRVYYCHAAGCQIAMAQESEAGSKAIIWSVKASHYSEALKIEVGNGCLSGGSVSYFSLVMISCVTVFRPSSWSVSYRPGLFYEYNFLLLARFRLWCLIRVSHCDAVYEVISLRQPHLLYHRLACVATFHQTDGERHAA